MNKNIFVIGLDPYNRRKLQGIRHCCNSLRYSLEQYWLPRSE